MFQLSPLLKFALYFVFTFICVYYLTRDRLDEKSRYILVALLIVPYLFMEQINNYENVPTNTISPYERVSPLVKKGVENKARINPPKIEHYEDVKNLNVLVNQNDVKEQFNNLAQPPKKNKPEPKVENHNNIIEKFTNDDISKVIALLQNVQQAQTTNPSNPDIKRAKDYASYLIRYGAIRENLSNNQITKDQQNKRKLELDHMNIVNSLAKRQKIDDSNSSTGTNKSDE